MPKFHAPLDLSRAELRNAVTQNLGTAPSTPLAGLRFYDTVSNTEQYWNGTRWVVNSDTIDASNITGLGDLALLDQVGAAEILPGVITDSHISPTAAIALSKLAVDPLARANHTGTQLAATISDFDTQVRTNPINLLATATGTVDFGNQILANVGDPVLDSHAANKAYVDSVAGGLDVHAAVRAASTADVDLAAPGATIDGVTLANGDRVLVKDQVDPTENGVYIFNGAAAAMTRAPDADVDPEIQAGFYVLVNEGAVNANSGWILTTPNPITIGTTPLTFAKFSGGGSSYTGTPGRIIITGTQIDIDAAYVGQSSLNTLGTVTTGVWNATPIDIAYGGTGATTAAGARAALGTIGKHTQTIGLGDGTTTTFDVDHNLNSLDVGVELYEALVPNQTLYADVRRVNPNKITIEGFVTAPALNAIRVVVWG